MHLDQKVLLLFTINKHLNKCEPRRVRIGCLRRTRKGGKKLRTDQTELHYALVGISLYRYNRKINIWHA
jgi:hypothetical protein